MEVTRDQKKVISVTFTKPLTVIAGSIGSDIRYEMSAKELTNRTIFVETESPGRLPFNAASLIEIWVELQPGKSIFFLGRMDQKIMPAEARAQGTRPGIYVNLLQIEPEDEKLLHDTIIHFDPERSQQAA